MNMPDNEPALYVNGRSLEREDCPAPARIILDHAEDDATLANAIGTYAPYRVAELFYKEEGK